MKYSAVISFAVLAGVVFCGVFAEDYDFQVDPGFIPYEPPECKEGEEICGFDQCYVPGGDQICHDNSTLCDKAEEPCAWNCFKPETQECHEGLTVCEKSEDMCGYQCVTPSPDKHCLKSTYSSYFCDIAEDVCGSWGCFSPEQKQCFNDRDRLCEKGEQACGIWGGTGCYDPSTHNCVDNELVPK